MSGANVYIAGKFINIADFGSTSLTSAGGADVFVAKLVDAGTTASFIWVRQGGGTGDDAAQALAVSGTSVYVAGTCGSTATFGGTTLPGAATTAEYMYVAKLTDGGNTAGFEWAREGAALTYGLALAANGPNVYVGGYFVGSTLILGSSSLPNYGGIDGFVAKLTDAGPNGDFVWAQRAGGAGADRIQAVAVSGASVYVAGYYSSGRTQAFGALNVSSTNNDLFVAKLTDAGTSGTYDWVQASGSGPGRTTVDVAYALAVNGPNVYVAGSFTGTNAIFGSINLAGGSAGEVLVAKLLDAGTSSSFVWAQKAGGPAHDYATALAVSGANVYVGGLFHGPTANFSGLSLANSGTTYLGFLASLTDAGALATTSPVLAAGLRLWPNPAHASVAVAVPTMPGAAHATLTLLDGLGRVVRTQRLGLAAAGTTAEVLLTGLAPGLYHLRVQAGAQQASCPLVVE